MRGLKDINFIISRPGCLSPSCTYLLLKVKQKYCTENPVPTSIYPSPARNYLIIPCPGSSRILPRGSLSAYWQSSSHVRPPALPIAVIGIHATKILPSNSRLAAATLQISDTHVTETHIPASEIYAPTLSACDRVWAPALCLLHRIRRPHH